MHVISETQKSYQFSFAVCEDRLAFFVSRTSSSPFAVVKVSTLVAFCQPMPKAKLAIQPTDFEIKKGRIAELLQSFFRANNIKRHNKQSKNWAQNLQRSCLSKSYPQKGLSVVWIRPPFLLSFFPSFRDFEPLTSFFLLCFGQKSQGHKRFHSPF